MTVTKSPSRLTERSPCNIPFREGQSFILESVEKGSARFRKTFAINTSHEG
jgi:hypothetical protein